MPMPAMAAGMNRSFIVRTLSLLPVYLTLQSDSEFDLEFGQNDLFIQAVNKLMSYCMLMRLRLKPEVKINEPSHISCIDCLVENWRLNKSQVRSFFILVFEIFNFRFA